jgi:hypothetical protein
MNEPTPKWTSAKVVSTTPTKKPGEPDMAFSSYLYPVLNAEEKALTDVCVRDAFENIYINLAKYANDNFELGFIKDKEVFMSRVTSTNVLQSYFEETMKSVVETENGALRFTYSDPGYLYSAFLDKNYN